MYIEDYLKYFINANSIGIILEVLFVFILFILLKYFKNISIILELIYEKVFNFYEDILGKGEKSWIKTYIVILFFIILLSNILGIIVEFIAPIFGFDNKGNFILEHYITIPTSDLNFTIAISIISILMLLFIQISKIGFKHFLLEYFPVNGKKFIVYDLGADKNIFKLLIKFFTSIFDIFLSIFLGLLEILGLVAKTASLSLRLFGNMMSGTILVTLVIVGMSLLTKELTGFMGGINFPIILPIIIYLQEILVAFIQALIFPLLMAIFIKVSSLNEG